MLTKGNFDTISAFGTLLGLSRRIKREIPSDVPNDNYGKRYGFYPCSIKSLWKPRESERTSIEKLYQNHRGTGKNNDFWLLVITITCHNFASPGGRTCYSFVRPRHVFESLRRNILRPGKPWYNFEKRLTKRLTSDDALPPAQTILFYRTDFFFKTRPKM